MRVQSLAWEDLLEEKTATPFQYSRLENPMDRGAWRAPVRRVAKNQSLLKQLPGMQEVKGRHRGRKEARLLKWGFAERRLGW